MAVAVTRASPTSNKRVYHWSIEGENGVLAVLARPRPRPREQNATVPRGHVFEALCVRRWRWRLIAVWQLLVLGVGHFIENKSSVKCGLPRPGPPTNVADGHSCQIIAARDRPRMARECRGQSILEPSTSAMMGELEMCSRGDVVFIFSMMKPYVEILQ